MAKKKRPSRVAEWIRHVYLPFGKGTFDYNFLAIVILLFVFGLIMLYSSSAYEAELSQSSDMYFLIRQAMIGIPALLMAVLISRIDYHILYALSNFLYLVSLGLMVAVRFIGSTTNGAARWINIGPIQFQPSELAKVAVIIWIPSMNIFLEKRKFTEFGKMLVMGLGTLLLAGVAFFFTSHLSGAIIIFSIGIGMLFVLHSGSGKWALLGAFAAVLIGMVLIFLIYRGVITLDTTSFRFKRIMTWLRPEDFSDDDTMQSLQAMYAIGSGGLFGKGLGNSYQKMGNVPEVYNDMIFSVICEELGVFGVAIIMLMYGYLFYRMILIAQNSRDLYGSLMVIGVFLHIAIQVILNIAVVLRVIPNTGVTLPFFSYGGTATLFLMAEIGLVMSIASRLKSNI